MHRIPNKGVRQQADARSQKPIEITIRTPQVELFYDTM